jgi:two-component system sensor histidine kinase KdpD
MDLILAVAFLREVFRWLLATAVTAMITAILVLLHADSGTAGIVYLVLVVWFATLTGRTVSIYLAVFSSFLFDYFFLEPLHSFGISGFQSWCAMIAYVLSCIVVGRVAERARRQTRQAERRREDVERLYALSQEMMLHEDAAGLVREIPRLVEHNFNLDAVILYVRAEDKLYSSVPVKSSRMNNLPSELPTTTTENSAFENLHQALSELSTRSEISAELPYGYFPIDLIFGMNSVGTLAWKPATLSREVATSVAAQVAIAITRAHAIETSARMEAARSADRLRTALIDSLTHELRTPLTAIRAAATTLIDGYGLDEESRTELAAIVDEESSRLDTLIGEAMQMAEIDSDGIRIKPEPLHTLSFLEQVAEVLHTQLASHQVTIIVQQPDNPVWFDPHLIGRVLHHLLENAVRYTPANSRILLRSRRVSGRLEFVVEDNGPGIDPHDLPMIFEKFYRGKHRGVAPKGSGMGLAIARAILTAHGGAIHVQSIPGKGTTFTLWIPEVEKAPAFAGEAATQKAS